MSDTEQFSTMKNSDDLFNWFYDVWVKRDHNRIAGAFHPELSIFGPLHGAISAEEDYAEIVHTLANLLVDIDITKTHGVTEGDLCAVRLHVTGRGVHSDQVLDYYGQLMVRLENGQIREFLSNFDYMTMFEQLGQLPDDCLPICMTGERLQWVEPATSRPQGNES
ncbi:nuclear transport factor 2 family protein [Phaeobacter sp.]|uniref:nuclear transport factor 2 family protein n=1 Tax=Phaeobacter sp. TaxID=1902409 RepID=UPI0025F122D5|nr:nuclear transport factor 2 family protein [Phaeobacter sp.]